MEGNLAIVACNFQSPVAMGSGVTQFRRTAWFLLFMVMTFSMLGGPAALICVGCGHTAIEFGSCCCDDDGNCSADQSDDCDPEPFSSEPTETCGDCAELVFRLEETPVEKNTIEPAAIVFVYTVQFLELTPSVSPPIPWNHRGHPSDASPPLRFARIVRLLI